MRIKSLKTRVFKESEDLIGFILEYVEKLPEESILAVTSKIVALSQGRVERLRGEKDKIRIIKEESDLAVKTKHAWLTMKDGMLMPSAGVDESNADGKLILLPKDSFKAAGLIRKELGKIFKIKRLGVVITDSRVMPMRAGTVGMAVGYSGFKGVKDYRGKKDIFGRKFKYSRTDVADSIATAAVLCMGEGDERRPLALVSGAPVSFSKSTDGREIIIDPGEDLFFPLYAKKKSKK